MGGSDEEGEPSINTRLGSIEKSMRGIAENFRKMTDEKLFAKLEDLHNCCVESQDVVTTSVDISKATILTQLNKLETLANLISEKVLSLSKENLN